MSNHNDIAAMYAASRRRSFNESVRDAKAEIDIAHKDVRYYMCMPRDYIVKRGVHILLAFMVCIIACYSLFTATVPPLFLIVFRKWKSYCRICSSVNISSRKLNILLAGWFLIGIFINIIFWNWLTEIL